MLIGQSTSSCYKFISVLSLFATIISTDCQNVRGLSEGNKKNNDIELFYKIFDVLPEKKKDLIRIINQLNDEDDETIEKEQELTRSGITFDYYGDSTERAGNLQKTMNHLQKNYDTMKIMKEKEDKNKYRYYYISNPDVFVDIQKELLSSSSSSSTETLSSNKNRRLSAERRNDGEIRFEEEEEDKRFSRNKGKRNQNFPRDDSREPTRNRGKSKYQQDDIIKQQPSNKRKINREKIVKHDNSNNANDDFVVRKQVDWGDDNKKDRYKHDNDDEYVGKSLGNSYNLNKQKNKYWKKEMNNKESMEMPKPERYKPKPLDFKRPEKRISDSYERPVKQRKPFQNNQYDNRNKPMQYQRPSYSERKRPENKYEDNFKPAGRNKQSFGVGKTPIPFVGKRVPYDKK